MEDMESPFDKNLEPEEDLGPSWLEKNFGRIIGIAIILFLGALTLL